MEKLFKEAQKVLNNSYSPYSNFKVACAILMNDGRIITGVNVENASYGLSICAERNAMFHSIALGYKAKDVKALLTTTDKEYFVTPCDACRQVIKELCAEDAKIYVTNSKGDCHTYTVDELLPDGFSEGDL